MALFFKRKSENYAKSNCNPALLTKNMIKISCHLATPIKF